MSAPQKQCCRYLKADGRPCQAVALRGQHYCYSHLRHRQPSFSSSFATPLLEDAASIRLVISQVIHATLHDEIPLRKADTLLRALRLALSLLHAEARQESNRLRHLAHEQKKNRHARPTPAPEPVDELHESPSGEPLAPEREYHGPNGKKERVFSMQKMMYNEHLKKTGRDPIEDPDKFPEEGYMTKAELIEERNYFNDKFGEERMNKILGPLDLDASADPGADSSAAPSAEQSPAPGAYPTPYPARNSPSIYLRIIHAAEQYQSTPPINH